MTEFRLQIFGAVAAAVASSLCCMVPLLLVLAGLGGAWLNTLTALEPVRPVFIVITVGLLAWSGYRLYRKPQACAPGDACAVPANRRRQRRVFWTLTVFIAVLIAFPWYAPYIL